MTYPCGLTYHFQAPRGSERAVRAYKLIYKIMGDNFSMHLDMSNIRGNHSQGGISYNRMG